MAIELRTEDKLEYTWYPVQGQQLQFRVKAPHDAHIAFTTAASTGTPMWEVFIGGWGNTKSVIRKNETKPDAVEALTEAYLTDDEFRGFWIRWNKDSGELNVGKEGEMEPFMSWADPQPFEPTYFGLCTGWGATGEWMIEAICIANNGDGYNQNNMVGQAAPTDEGTMWVDATDGQVPPNALVGGDDNGEPLYVGRADHEGSVIPGKIKSSHGVCYVPHGGEEHSKNQYQVLCSSNLSWVPASNDDIPTNAIPCGQTEDGEPLFAGRVNHEGSLTIGKVHPSHRVIYIPYGGQELAFGDYEILVSND